jgi:iron complex transport system permease protein
MTVPAPRVALPSPTPAAATGSRRQRRWSLIGAAVLALVAVGVVLSLCVGTRTISPENVWTAIVAPTGSDDDVVVRDLRVPRTLLGLAVGAALGMAGALIQGHTRNPIADPGLLGVSAGAAFAVVLGITLFGVTHPLAYVWFSFPGALAAAVVVFVLGSTGRGAATPVTLALAGAGVTALLGALTTALVLMDPDTLDGFRFWAVGSIAGRGPDVLLQLAPFLAAGTLLALVNTRAMNLLSLGEDTARALGLGVPAARAVGVTALTLLTGAAVAAAGPIAFLGLIVPHAARALTGADYRALLPVAGLLGAFVLLVADSLGRIAAPPGELQVGIVLAGLGAPFFITLVRRRRLVAV